MAIFTISILGFSSQASAQPPKSFIFIGSGYGHGVGLSQYGAKGQALEGKSAVEILNYYFPEAQVTPVADTATIVVNVAHQVSALEIELPPNDFAILANKTMTSTNLEPQTPLNFEMNGKFISGPIGQARRWIINWNNPESIILLKRGNTTMKLNHGFIKLRSVKIPGVGFRIEATNHLRLHDEYLYGIAEVPSSWPSAALESQVIASRTYALMRMKSIKRACDCHVYNSKYDQAFVGYSKEGEPRYGKLWKAAVDATATDESSGLAITINQRPVSVFFSSSSGGFTQRPVDVWGTDIAHLVNVADPWSIDPANNKNYASWRKKVSQRKMAKAFGLPDVERYEITARTITKSVLSITAFSSAGEVKTLSIGTFKSAVKLPSSWFDLPTSPINIEPEVIEPEVIEPEVVVPEVIEPEVLAPEIGDEPSN